MPWISKGAGKSEKTVAQVRAEMKPDLETLLHLKDSLVRLEETVQLTDEQKRSAERIVRQVEELKEAIGRGNERAQIKKEAIMADCMDPESGKLRSDRLDEFNKALLAGTTSHVPAIKKATATYFLGLNMPMQDVEDLQKLLDANHALVERTFAPGTPMGTLGHARAKIAELAGGKRLDSSLDEIFIWCNRIDITKTIEEAEYNMILATALDKAREIAFTKTGSTRSPPNR